MNDTLDSCGAVVAGKDDPVSGFTGWGQETVPALFRPLQSCPQIDIPQEDDKLDLADLDIDPTLKETIQERVKAKLDRNRDHAKKAMVFSLGLFNKVYDQLA